MWVRLGDICSVLTDGTHQTPTYSDEGYVFLSSKNVTTGKIDWDNVMYIPEELHNILHSRLAPELGDVLLAKNGTTGFAAVVDRDCVFDIYVSLALLRTFKNEIFSEYLRHMISSQNVQDHFKGHLKGIGVPNLHLEHIRTAPIPIPPLAEQHRIVVAIESAFMVIDEIERNKTDLQALAVAAKSKILSLAIRGKLVPQDPSDEPADILLERIRNERESLIKTGKIRRGKAGSAVIRGGDSPYYKNLPDGWIAAPVAWLFLVVGGGTPSTSRTEYWGNGIPWFSSADIDDKGIITPRRYVTQLGLDNSTVNVVPKGNIVVVTRVGLGKVTILDCDMCFSQDNQALIPHYLDVVDNCYLYHFLFHEMQTLKDFGRGTTISGITKKQLADIILLLPPIAEQRRIVTAIETTYKCLDKIAESLI
jgi:type I restriction enzyme S subunit